MSRQSVLVGRDAERAVIEAALERCRANEGGFVLVSGEAGVGKSRLVADALRGWQARRLRASAVGGGRSYGLLREMLLTVHEEIADADVRRSLGPLLPGNGMPDAEYDSATLADSLRRVLRLVADDGPTVVVLEDLHWTDAATLDILPALAVAIEREPVLIVATYRSDQLPRAHPLRRARTELRRGGGLIEVALRPLTREQSGELLAGLLGGPVTARLLTEIHSRADGLPFVVEELAATLTEAGSLRECDGGLEVAADAGIPLPESVVDAVLARTADLRTAHLEAVELAAVLGVGVQLPVLAELVPPDDVDELLDLGLLVEQARAGSEVAVFRHALVREALYGGIPWARRRRHHVRAAKCLTDHAASPEVVAEHWIAAHEYDRARPLLLAAAEQNCSLHAYRDAARIAGRALEVWPERVDPDGRIIALERLAGCAELCDEHESAADVWATLAGLRQEAGDVAGVGVANRRQRASMRVGRTARRQKNGSRSPRSSGRPRTRRGLSPMPRPRPSPPRQRIGRTCWLVPSVCKARFGPRPGRAIAASHSQEKDSRWPWHCRSPSPRARPFMNWRARWSSPRTTQPRPTPMSPRSNCAARTTSPSWLTSAWPVCPPRFGSWVTGIVRCRSVPRCWDPISRPSVCAWWRRRSLA